MTIIKSDEINASGFGLLNTTKIESNEIHTLVFVPKVDKLICLNKFWVTGKINFLLNEIYINLFVSFFNLGNRW